MNFRLVGAALGAASVLGATSFCLAQKPASTPVTATGIVAGAPQNRDFRLRVTPSLIYDVNPHSGVDMTQVRGGDAVRVYGKIVGAKIYHANVRVLRRGASTVPEDYD